MWISGLVREEQKDRNQTENSACRKNGPIICKDLLSSRTTQQDLRGIVILLILGSDRLPLPRIGNNIFQF